MSISVGQPYRVLLVQYSGQLDGSTISGLLLLDGLRRAGFATDVAFGTTGGALELYKQHGHQVHTIVHPKWLSHSDVRRSLRDIWHQWKVSTAFAGLFEAQRPDLVYVNTVVSLGAVLAARRGGLACVWHLRELLDNVGGEMRLPRLLRPLAKAALRFLPDALVAPSRVIASCFFGLDGEAVVRIVPNAVAGTYFSDVRGKPEARALLSAPSDGTLIGVPGMLREIKGHAFFFDAVAPLLRADPSVKVLVTGDGLPTYRNSLDEQIAGLGIKRQVMFLGVVKDMVAFYRACDIVCVPSRSEPFGRTVIEAHAVGTPVVATAVDGIRETIEDARTGLLVPFGDTQALTAALQRMLHDASLRLQIREQAVEVARQRFHESQYQRSLLTLVQEVIAARKAGAGRK